MKRVMIWTAIAAVIVLSGWMGYKHASSEDPAVVELREKRCEWLAEKGHDICGQEVR